MCPLPGYYCDGMLDGEAPPARGKTIVLPLPAASRDEQAVNGARGADRVNQDAVDLRGITAVLRRRWKIVAFFAVLFTLLSTALAVTQSPVFQATASLEVAPLNDQTPSNGIVMQPNEIATQMAVITSAPVAQRVIEQLKLTETPQQLLKSVSVSQEGDTRVLDVSAHRPTAQSAADVANAFAEEFLSFRYERGVAEAQAQQKGLQAQAASLRKQYDSFTAQIDAAQRRGDTAAVTSLQNRQQAVLVQLTQVLDAQAALAAAAPTPGAGGEPLIPATPPKGKASPKPLRSAVLGLIVGLMIGVGVAFVRDYFDDGIRDEQRMRDILAPKAVLGKIPVWGQASSGRVVSIIEPASPAAEAFRGLSTNVRFLMAAQRGHGSVGTASGRTASSVRQSQHSGQIVLVTSAMPSEGKTDVAANLAVAMSRYGLKVVIVDADLRLPQLAPRFGLGNPPGLTDFLAGEKPLNHYLIDVAGVKLLPGGNLAPNPAELLASSEMTEVLNSLTRSFDVVLIDSTPVLRVADTLELVGRCDATVVVARYGSTRARSLNECIERIQQVGGNVSGAVLVAVPATNENDPYGAYYYSVDRPMPDASDAPVTPESRPASRSGRG